MAGFVQIIEYKSSKREELKALADEYRPQLDLGYATRVIVSADKERSNTYMTVAEFDSHQAAMENSKRPATAEYAGKMAALCDGEPTFYNLDVIDQR